MFWAAFLRFLRLFAANKSNENCRGTATRPLNRSIGQMDDFAGFRGIVRRIDQAQGLQIILAGRLGHFFAS
jgi:hypothetical protein